jgi:hypothetical protein
VKTLRVGKKQRANYYFHLYENQFGRREGKKKNLVHGVFRGKYDEKNREEFVCFGRLGW